MDGREKRIFTVGILTGAVATFILLGGLAAAWGWHQGIAARSHAPVLSVVPVQQQAPTLNPNEFIPLPNDQGPQNLTPGLGDQNCDKILYFYQGRLYQLRPGPTPRNGGNPEFFFMEPYQGPQIPGFPNPNPMIPGGPVPSLPGEPVPPTLRF
jgi:hypothetical protein